VVDEYYAKYMMMMMMMILFYFKSTHWSDGMLILMTIIS